MENKFVKVILILFNVFYIFTVVCSNKPVFSGEEDNNYSRAEEVDLRNASTLLDLDTYIYDVLVDPTKGTAAELLDKFELITHCMRKARLMFTLDDDQRDYDIRAATLVFFNTGGPTFSRIPLYLEENTLPIKREFKWDDNDIKKLEEIQAEAERAWSKLRKSIL